ncbi:MAG: 3-keto-5-aminohexanoate cleavage protein [Gammaproteobacteria bacterium]|nr:3-keto-5-aminohexanoate cleavage protein [Gammaproteobacteria bacterium]
MSTWRSDLTNTPGIMLAPNGARLTTDDHPAIPVTEADTVKAVVEGVEAGACAVHLHVRDEHQGHLLDVARYRSAIAKLKVELGQDFPIQVTTEAVGIYTQPEQIAMMRELKPEFASVALAEIAGSEELLSSAEQFYHWADQERVGLQHILYSPEDLTRFLDLKTRGVIPAEQWSVIFVLGRYTKDQQSDPAVLQEFLTVVDAAEVRQSMCWMICAFGSEETNCLTMAAAAGGHNRIGFENNRQHADGSIAANNTERVTALVTALAEQGRVPCDRSAMRAILGG